MKTQVELPPPAFKKNFRPARRENRSGAADRGWAGGFPGALVLSLAMLLEVRRARPGRGFRGHHGDAQRDLHRQHVPRLRRNARRAGKPFISQDARRHADLSQQGCFRRRQQHQPAVPRTVTGARRRAKSCRCCSRRCRRGNNAIRVEVDGRHEGRSPRAQRQQSLQLQFRNQQMGAVFISRSLDYDAVSNVFQATAAAPFTAAMATGSAGCHQQRRLSQCLDARHPRLWPRQLAGTRLRQAPDR
jgi:hypothetical protein